MSGKSYRKGITVIELATMFPDEQAAVDWFESIMWPEQRCCGHCGSINTKETPGRKPMPYWCTDCRSYFSVKTGSSIQNSKISLRKWAFAIYLYVTNIKGISSMRLHREIGVTQKTAWFMLHRLREGWNDAGLPYMAGPVEVDETYIGGKRKNMPKAKRVRLEGRGASGKAAVVGAKDRSSKKVAARVVKSTDAETLQGFVVEHTASDATVYTDEALAYKGLPYKHEAVKHSIGEYVKGEAHTNGIESFWSMIKRGYYGTYHQISEKHLERYVGEFAGRHNVREHDTAKQMQHLAASLTGKQLLYRDLIQD